MSIRQLWLIYAVIMASALGGMCLGTLFVPRFNQPLEASVSGYQVPTRVQPQASVLVPLYDIPAGTTLSANDFVYNNVAQNTVPSQAVTSRNGLDGQVALEALPRRQPFTMRVIGDPVNVTPPTVVPIPDGACVAASDSAGYSPLLYGTSFAVLQNGQLAPEQQTIVVAMDNDRYQLQLAGGLELGWVHRDDVVLSGDCVAYE